MTTLPRSMNRVGKASKRREPWLDRTRKILVQRSGGKCEGDCGRRGIPLDPAHLAGRGNKGIGEPWASCPELMVALCREEHNAIDRSLDPMLLSKLQWRAFDRLGTRLDLRWTPTPDDPHTPLGALRVLVSKAEARGITHPDYEL